MLNFIIDTSVFALSRQSEDINIEKNNLCMLRDNIACLKKLQYNNSVTVSYMNKILLRLRDNNYLINKAQINSRIEELLKKQLKKQLKNNPDCQFEIGLDSVIFDNWDEFLFKEITPKKYKSENDKPEIIRKGKIGIFKNIPDRDDDPSENYIKKTDIAEEDKIYPELPSDFLKTFKKYCGYIAELNSKYYSSDNNYFVLGNSYGNQKKKDIKVKIKKEGNKIQSRINIIGIQNAVTLCPQNEQFGNLITACQRAIKEFSNKLYFCEEINNNNIQKDLLEIAGPPETIYHYLETLYRVSKIADDKSINIQKEEELVELLNSYGLLCSPDDKKYKKNGCRYRKFYNKLGKKKIFNIHLKPATYNNNPPDEDDTSYTLGGTQGTVRIYLDWDNTGKKFVLGWIGHHPPFCQNCVITNCQGKLYTR